MITEEEIIEIGKFQKTHALKGELNTLLDVDPEYLTDGHPAIVDVDGIYVPFYADSVRPKGTFSYLVKLQGIDTEEEAREFVNHKIYGLREEVKRYLAEEDEEIALFDELIGLTAIDEHQGVIGEITYIDDSTDNPLFHIETPEGDTVYVPVHDDFITAVSPEEGEIRFNLPDGLIDINKK
ncbi:MAG: ribosome maturation factor RimM [Muribaculaceae bacterium]|nr:ribosome maturation factor RimM [Muribaculaceae bacterium]